LGFAERGANSASRFCDRVAKKTGSRKVSEWRLRMRSQPSLRRLH
jgi:hypothetical protein